MIKETASKPIPIVDLIGDMEENYYQLGLKDAEAAKLGKSVFLLGSRVMPMDLEFLQSDLCWPA